MRVHLESAEKHALAHALRVAAQTFRADAKNFEEVTADTAYMTAAAAKQMVTMFNEYARGADSLLDRIEGADSVILEQSDD